ncbi:MAG: flavin-containing monooxygenase [Rhizobiaceae bacterium]
MEQSFRVCVIGAGAGGLSMARALQRHNIAYDHFERHSDVGGVWDQDNPGSAMYDSAHMISSKSMSAFKGYPMPADYPDYPGHRQILAYLRSFATDYNLRDNIRFGTEIENAERKDGRWEVTLAGGETRHYNGVVAATGLAWHPRMPEYPGEFAGETIHSSKYRSPDMFKGKRVLVIGAGNSGVDIAADAARSASKAFLSMRRAYHFIPKHIFGMPADVFALTGSIFPMKIQQWTFAVVLKLLNGDVTRHGLRKPDHLPLTSHPIVNTSALLSMAHGDLTPKVDVDRFDGNEVIFEDGSREEVDMIVCATGYIHKVPFADPGLLDNSGEESNLFMRTISRKEPTFSAVGFIEINGGVYQFYDEFNDVAANFFRDLADGSPKAAQFEAIVKSGAYDVSGKVAYVESPRHHVYANVLESMKQVKKLKRKMGWKRLVDSEMRPETDKPRLRAGQLQAAE